MGLVSDTRLRTASMPASKIDKALARVRRLQAAESASRRELDCLLGSLRHVCCCLRAAKPFFQRVHTAAKRTPRRGKCKLTEPMKHDLQWLEMIFVHGQWSGLPLNMFTTVPPADVHIYMDSSDQGLAVLDPANHRYIQVRYDEEERASFGSTSASSGLDINVRELFCAALAAVLWGPTWRPSEPSRLTHVLAWSDNASTVSWINKLASDNTYAQELIRAIGLSEAVHQFRMSARHPPGAANRLADAGSRVWNGPTDHLWTNTISSWSQTPVPAAARKLYTTFSGNYSPKHWPSAASESTKRRGGNGRRGAKTKATPHGSPAQRSKTRTSSSSSLFGAGHPAQGGNATRRPPFCPRLARLAGFIADVEDFQSDSTLDTKLRCKGCDGCLHLPPGSYQCPPASSVTSVPAATSPKPMIAFSGGLRSWAISTCYGDRNTCRTEVQQSLTQSSSETSNFKLPVALLQPRKQVRKWYQSGSEEAKRTKKDLEPSEP